MNNLFFNESAEPSQFADKKKRTRTEQVDIVDRWLYSDHFEDHPKGYVSNGFRFFSDINPVGRPKGAKGLTTAEREERKKRGELILQMLGIGMRYDEIGRQPGINLEPGQVREIARYWQEKGNLS
jgi:hypothetical protein